MTGSSSSVPAGPVLRLDRVTAGYTRRPVWSDMSVAVEPGEFLAVLGGNGSGKTTLLRLLLGQLRPQAGRLTVLGRPARRGNPRVGYVPQQRVLDPNLPLRGVDLVRLGLDGHRWGIGLPSHSAAGQVDRALNAVGATAYGQQPIGRLSGGQQQRLRIAQALVADPRLLLADEPLLSLDLGGQQQICAALDAHRRSTGAAVVVVTHEVNPVLPYADRLLYLGGGRWAAGPAENVLTSEALTRLYKTPVDVLHLRGRVLIVGAPENQHHLADAAEPR